jgi:hypothetical protein
LARCCKVAGGSGCIDCTTSKDNSSQAMPKRKKAIFKQVKLLGDSNKSGLEWSSADAELLILARLRKVTSDSGCTDCATNKNNSSQAIPKRTNIVVKQVAPLGASNKLGLEWSSADVELPILVRLRKVTSDLGCTDCVTGGSVPS